MAACLLQKERKIKKMKVKYAYTLYNKNNPYGVEKTVTVSGKPCKKPTYLAGCDTGYIFIKTKSEKKIKRYATQRHSLLIRLEDEISKNVPAALYSRQGR